MLRKSRQCNLLLKEGNTEAVKLCIKKKWTEEILKMF